MATLVCLPTEGTVCAHKSLFDTKFFSQRTNQYDGKHSEKHNVQARFQGVFACLKANFFDGNSFQAFH
jgi:hypothetical protein